MQKEVNAFGVFLWTVQTTGLKPSRVHWIHWIYPLPVQLGRDMPVHLFHVINDSRAIEKKGSALGDDRPDHKALKAKSRPLDPRLPEYKKDVGGRNI
jgi:hypothetical protein